MTEFNDIGIARQLDMPRVKKLLAIGLFASVLHMIGDMILGWGVEDETLTGVLRMVSAYTGTPDGGILAAALLGLFGMVLEGARLFRGLPSDRAVFPKARPPLSRGHIRLSDVRRLRLSCTDLRARISGQTRSCRRMAPAVCRLFPAAGVCAVLDIFPGPLRGADLRLCQGADALPEMGLGVFAAGRHADRHAAECVRQSAVCQRALLRMDRIRQSLDVRRAFDPDGQGAEGLTAGGAIKTDTRHGRQGHKNRPRYPRA